MIPTSKQLCLVAMVGCFMTVQLALCQNDDELKFKGEGATNIITDDNNNNKQASPTDNNKQVSPTNSDTTITIDPPSNNQNNSPNLIPNDNINNNNNNQQLQPNDYDNNEDQEREQFRPHIDPFKFMMPFNIMPFGGQQPSFDRRPNNLFGGSGEGGRMIDSLFGHINERAREMDRHFSELKRQAVQGQDVSYFRRGGEAYVRTCTTRKLSPGEQTSNTDQEIKDLEARPSFSRARNY